MTSSPTTADSGTASMRRVALASAIGTTIEWYDFLVYSTAATLLLNKLFFPVTNAFTSELLSIATIGVGFYVRPLGAIILSHFGDRAGRRSVLIFTLLTMGIATMAIGLLPTYASAGIAAPILLVVCRCVQGMAVGGEWGSAALLVIEHAPPGRRGFYGSLVQVGFPLGMALGTAAFFALGELGDAQLLAWGWRLPFLVSAALVVVGTFIRLRVGETPEFRRVVQDRQLVRFPVLEAIRHHPLDLLRGLGARVTEVSWIYVITIFGLSYAVTRVGLDRQLVLGAITVGAALELITIPLSGALSDRIGRRPVYMLGCAAAILLSFPIFWAIQPHQPLLSLLAFVIGMSFGHGIMYGVQASFLSELFPASIRHSGASLGYQLAAPIGGGVVPVIAAWLAGGTQGATWPVSVLMIAITLITVVAVASSRETAPAVADARPLAQPAADAAQGG